MLLCSNSFFYHLFNLICRVAQIDGVIGPLGTFLGVQILHHAAGAQNRAGTHGVFVQTHPKQQRHCQLVTGHFTTHGGFGVVGMGRIDHMLDQAQESGIQWLIQVGDGIVATISRKALLNQVVGSDTEEVDLFGQLIGVQGSQRHFDHHPDLDVVA